MMKPTQSLTLPILSVVLMVIDVLMWTNIGRDNDIMLWIQAQAAEKTRPVELSMPMERARSSNEQVVAEQGDHP